MGITNIKEKQFNHTGKMLDLINAYLETRKVRPQDFVEISYDVAIALLAQTLSNYDEDTQIDMLNNVGMDIQDCMDFMKLMQQEE